MSEFLGAWSLEAAGKERHVREMRQRLAGALPVGDAPRARTGARWWLRGAGADISEAPSVVVARTGIVAGERPAAVPPGLQAGEPTAEGHYAAVRIDRDANELVLARSVSGGERLFFTVHDGLFVFATSLRPLLGLAERELEREASEAVIHCGHVLNADATVFAGIREVLPGHWLTVGERVGDQRWMPHVEQALAPPEGDPQGMARRFRAELASSIEALIGPARPVAVALSGGIDSSAIAAAAVEVVGADAITAFSYEFDDPRHATETHFSREVCASLGIRDHRVFRIDPDRFFADIPEAVWRAESPVYWPKSFLLQVGEHLRREGFDRYLSGFGVGSHMDDLATIASRLARRGPGETLPGWYDARFRRKRRFALPAWMHAVPTTHPRLHYPLVKRLMELGMLSTAEGLFPPDLAPLLRFVDTGSDTAAIDSRDDPSVLTAALQHHAVRRLLSCVDVTRSEKTSRVAGAMRVSPAHLARTLPYAYFPVSPTLADWPRARHLRPGKYLLRLAYGRELPDSVLYRRKSWADAVASPGWLRAGRRLMQRALPDFPGRFEALGPGTAAAIRRFEPHAIQATGLSFAFFVELMRRFPGPRPPRWPDLIPGYRPGRRRFEEAQASE